MARISSPRPEEGRGKRDYGGRLGRKIMKEDRGRKRKKERERRTEGEGQREEDSRRRTKGGG